MHSSAGTTKSNADLQQHACEFVAGHVWHTVQPAGRFQLSYLGAGCSVLRVQKVLEVHVHKVVVPGSLVRSAANGMLVLLRRGWAHDSRAGCAGAAVARRLHRARAGLFDIWDDIIVIRLPFT